MQDLSCYCVILLHITLNKCLIRLADSIQLCSVRFGCYALIEMISWVCFMLVIFLLKTVFVSSCICFAWLISITLLLSGSRIGTTVHCLISSARLSPSAKFPFEYEKLKKNWHLKKKAKNCHFFQKKMSLAIFWINENFGIFGGKNVKFLAIFWQSNGNFPEGQPEIHV